MGIRSFAILLIVLGALVSAVVPVGVGYAETARPSGPLDWMLIDIFGPLPVSPDVPLPPRDDPSFPDGGGEPEDPLSPPRNPWNVALVCDTGRTVSSIKFRWEDRSLYEAGYELYRGPTENGPWMLRRSWQAQEGVGAWIEHEDQGLSPDTAYWYRIRVFNVQGESFTNRVFSTLDGRPVFRAQIRLRTANVSDAGTDDSVLVALGSSMNSGACVKDTATNSNFLVGRNLGSAAAWLDYSHDDWRTAFRQS